MILFMSEEKLKTTLLGWLDLAKEEGKYRAKAVVEDHEKIHHHEARRIPNLSFDDLRYIVEHRIHTANQALFLRLIRVAEDADEWERDIPHEARSDDFDLTYPTDRALKSICELRALMEET